MKGAGEWSGRGREWCREGGGRVASVGERGGEGEGGAGGGREGEGGVCDREAGDNGGILCPWDMGSESSCWDRGSKLCKHSWGNVGGNTVG